MSEEGGGASVSDKLIGVFIILFGLCMAFAGGACTAMAGAAMLHPGPLDSVVLSIVIMSITIPVAVGGLFMMRSGLRVSRSGYRPRRALEDKPDK